MEAFRLSAEMVSIDSDIKPPNELLAAFLGSIGRLREQDEAGAGAPCWFAMDPDK